MSILSGIGQTPAIFGTGGGTASSLEGGTAGSIPYQSAPDTTAFLANGSAGQLLTSQGTTLAPIWTTPNGLEYYNISPITTNLTDPTSNPTTNVSAFPPQSLGQGVYLVSFQITINNLDTAPVTFSDYQILLVQSVSVVALQQQQLFTLQPSQVYTLIFTTVLTNLTTTVPHTTNDIFLTVSSGAFATTAPTISTDNVAIVKIG
jgi:hypothetical protein